MMRDFEFEVDGTTFKGEGIGRDRMGRLTISRNGITVSDPFVTERTIHHVKWQLLDRLRLREALRQHEALPARA